MEKSLDLIAFDVFKKDYSNDDALVMPITVIEPEFNGSVPMYFSNVQRKHEFCWILLREVKEMSNKLINA